MCYFAFATFLVYISTPVFVTGVLHYMVHLQLLTSDKEGARGYPMHTLLKRNLEKSRLGSSSNVCR